MKVLRIGLLVPALWAPKGRVVVAVALVSLCAERKCRPRCIGSAN